MVVIICADVPMVDGDKSLHLDKLKSDLASAREAQGSVQNMTVTRNNMANRAFKVTWKHGIFAHRLPQRFKYISRIWLLMRGTILWHIWQERNEAAYDGIHWRRAKLY